jgi:hypothetical protein
LATYQDQLGDVLKQHGWDVVNRQDRGEWWDAASWQIESRRNQWGLSIILSFLVDPPYEGNRRESAVWAVAANSTQPQDRLEAEDAIALVSIRDFRFPDRLEYFVDEIDAYRNQLDHKTTDGK